MTFLLIDMMLVLTGMSAVCDVVLNMIGQRLAIFNGVAVLGCVDHALPPQGRVRHALGQDALRRRLVGG